MYRYEICSNNTNLIFGKFIYIYECIFTFYKEVE